MKLCTLSAPHRLESVDYIESALRIEHGLQQRRREQHPCNLILAQEVQQLDRVVDNRVRYNIQRNSWK